MERGVMRPRKRRLEPPTIETKRLVLRPLCASDLDAIVANVSDYDIAKMTTRIPHPYSEADGRTFLTAQSNATDAVNLAVEHEGTMVGIASLFSLPYRSEIGYWFAKSVWGKGIATETGRALLAYGFESLGLPVVHYRVFADNPASARVAEKLGFRRIGFGISRSLARGAEVAHIHSVLPAARFRAANRTS
jgi:RimJ/RimL family protein N-acetyltransferase